MKKLITIMAIILMGLLSLNLNAQVRNKYASAKYSPVSEFMDINTVLGQWYKQYKDTTSGPSGFEDFLRKLSDSEILLQRSKRAGVSHNQLYSPIITLLNKDFAALDMMREEELSTIQISMVELDIALAAIEATVPDSAIEEFRREILRGAPPLTEIAGAKKKTEGGVQKLPPSPVQVMQGLTVPEHKVSDTLNKPSPSLKTTPPKDAPDVVVPSNIPSGYYRDF